MKDNSLNYFHYDDIEQNHQINFSSKLLKKHNFRSNSVSNESR